MLRPERDESACEALGRERGALPVEDLRRAGLPSRSSRRLVGAQGLEPWTR